MRFSLLLKLRQLCFALATILVVWLVFREGSFYTTFAADTRAVLEQSDQVTVYALDPDKQSEHPCTSGKIPCFHDFPIVKTVAVSGNENQAALAAHLYRAWQPIPIPALCFIPHHGIRAVKNGHTVDVVLCFHCSAGKQWYDGSKRPAFPLGGGGHYFDEVLQTRTVAAPR